MAAVQFYPPIAFAAVDVTPYLPYLPIAAGCGVGLLALALLSARGRSSRPEAAPVLAPRPAGGDPGEPDDPSLANRRGAHRREGAPVRVMLSAPALRNKAHSGYVLDRSTGGLRIASSVELSAGSPLQVRAEHAPETTPWVTVIVRNCRNAGQHYELGCEFDQTPPWNVLLLFG